MKKIWNKIIKQRLLPWTIFFENAFFSKSPIIAFRVPQKIFLKSSKIFLMKNVKIHFGNSVKNILFLNIYIIPLLNRPQNSVLRILQKCLKNIKKSLLLFLLFLEIITLRILKKSMFKIPFIFRLRSPNIPLKHIFKI